jgi:hypothetical protein
MEVLFDIGISIAHAAGLCRALVTYPVWRPTQGPGSITQAAHHLWCFFRWLVRHIDVESQRLGLETHTAVQSDHLIKNLASLSWRPASPRFQMGMA